MAPMAATVQTSEVRRGLLEALRPTCEAAGFRLISSRSEFRRDVPAARRTFALSFAVYNWIEVIPGLGLRLHEVEAIFHRNSGFEKKYQAHTSTLSATLGSLSGDESAHSYHVAIPQDISTVAKRLEEDFHKVVLPYFEANSSMHRVDALLNGEPERPCRHNYNEEHRCAYGLIVAHLTGRGDYARLVQVYRERMARINNGYFLPRLDALLADLQGDAL